MAPILGLGSETIKTPTHDLVTNAFVPSDITKLILWIDGSDASTIYKDDGSGGFTLVTDTTDVVTKVTNKAYDGLGASSVSMNTHVEPGGSGTEPVYVTDVVNGHSVLRFAPGDLLRSTKSVGNVATNQMAGYTFDADDVTIFFIARHDSATITAPDQYIVGWTDGDRKSAGIACDSGDDQVFFVFEFGAAEVDSGQVWPNLSTGFQVWSSVSNGTNVRMFVDNASSPVITDTTDFSSYDRNLTVDSSSINFTVGSGIGQGSGNTFDGDICEVLIYDQALSDSEIDQVRDYFVTKYGL